jgi:hypothetical protein
MATTHILQQYRLANLVDLAHTLVKTPKDLGAALLLADVMAELRNRLPPTSFALLQTELRDEKHLADADREARTHDAPGVTQ